MGQLQSAEESMPRSCRRQERRAGFVNGSNGLRAGFRVHDSYARCRDAICMHHAGQSTAAAGTGAPQRRIDPVPFEREGLLGSGDEEDVQFLEALKGLVDGAVKLLGADKGVGIWLINGLLRRTGVVDSFVDSMVVFVDRRIGALVEVLSPKDAACAVARRLRQHAQAHDAFTAALGVRAGRKVSEGLVDGEGGEAGGAEQGELEEHDIQAVRLWRQWKRSGGFWPPQMPDPDDPMFDGPDETKEFEAKLDDGTQSFLGDISRSLLEVALPEDGGELQAACEAAAGDRGAASGSGAARGAGGDSSRSIMETASRLAQLKSGVLEPMLCQVLSQQVVGRFCRSAKLWQFVLQLLLPGAKLNPAARDMKYPEAFSLVAGALERSGSTPTATLKMELMQGLVKMAWGSTSDREGCDSRGSTVPAREPGTERTGGGNSGGAGAVNLERPAPTKPGSSEAAERSDSADGARRSETELDSGGTGMDGGHRSPRSGAASVATAGREKSGGARDIFNIPYTEQLSHGLVGGEKDKFYEDLEDHALEELANYLQSEIVDKAPLANVFLPKSWIPDRVKAARAFAKRPTNLMLVLSIIDAARSVFRAAGDKDRRKAARAANGARADTPIAVASSGGESKGDVDGGRPKTPIVRRQSTQVEGNGSDVQRIQSTSQCAGRRLRRQQRGYGRRDTPGWRVWEARRECFFGMDLGVVAVHFGRSLLGQEAMDLGDGFLKSVSLEYWSVEAAVRDEASNAWRKCSDTAAPEMLRKVKPLSTEPILYISSQMRMLRALKTTGLDFSKSFGDGPQKKALSRRFKSYSWVFTDALIDKLVDLRAEDDARSRAFEGEPISTGPLLPGGVGAQSGGVLFLDREPNKGASRAEREQRWKELKQQRRIYKGDIMREMTAGSGSSKDLLVKVVDSWLPEVLAADRAAERRVHGGPA